MEKFKNKTVKAINSIDLRKVTSSGIKQTFKPKSESYKHTKILLADDIYSKGHTHSMVSSKWQFTLGSKFRLYKRHLPGVIYDRKYR